MCLCVRVSAMIEATEMWIEEENEETGGKRKMSKQEKEINQLRRRITHYVEDLLFLFSVLFISTLLSPPLLSLFLSVFPSSLFLLRSLCVSHRESCSKEKRSPFFPSPEQHDNDNGWMVMIVMMRVTIYLLPTHLSFPLLVLVSSARPLFLIVLLVAATLP